MMKCKNYSSFTKPARMFLNILLAQISNLSDVLFVSKISVWDILNASVCNKNMGGFTHCANIHSLAFLKLQ